MQRTLIQILVLSTIIVSPGLQAGPVGLTNVFIPLVSFLILYRYGNTTGTGILVKGFLVGVVMSFLLQTPGNAIFSLVLLPGGYVLADSAAKGHSPFAAGLKTSALLGLCCFAYWSIPMLGEDSVSLSMIFRNLVEIGVESSLEIYRQSENISSETLLRLEQGLKEAREVLPSLALSFFTAILIAMVWMTMAFGNHLVGMITQNRPWESFDRWQLPDYLIWPAITAIFLTAFPSVQIRILGINLALVFGLIYFLQGVSIFVFFLNKWRLPMLLRCVLYLLIIFQTLGALVLTGVGIINTWVDFRQDNKNNS